MALFDREFIATPDDRKGQILYKHPDINIRRYTKAIVNVDQMALFADGSVLFVVHAAHIDQGQRPHEVLAGLETQNSRHVGSSEEFEQPS